LILVALASGSLGLKSGLSRHSTVLETPEAVAGQNVIADKFGAGIGNTTAVITNTAQAAEVTALTQSVPGVSNVLPGQSNGKITQLDVTIDAEPQSDAEYSVIQHLRDKLADLKGADALVGGL